MGDPTLNLLGVFGNNPQANPLDPAEYARLRAESDVLLQQYINRPTGPTLGQGLATALASALPAALGAIVGGKEGLGYGLTGGAKAAETSLAQIQAANDQQAEGSLLEIIRNRQQLQGADAYNADVLERKNKMADAISLAETLKGPQGIETKGQIAIDAARPRAFISKAEQDAQPADEYEIAALSKLTGKDPKEYEGLTRGTATKLKNIAEAQGGQDIRDSKFVLPPGSRFWDESAPPSEKVVRANGELAEATSGLNSKLTQLKAELAKPTSAQNMAAIRLYANQANQEYKKYAGTGANTTEIEIRKFLEGLTPNVFNNGMTSYMQYIRDSGLGIDPLKVLDVSMAAVQNGYSAKSFEQNVLTPSVAAFVDRANAARKAAGKPPVTPDQIRKLLAEGSLR